jgi:hypothetical protein
VLLKRQVQTSECAFLHIKGRKFVHCEQIHNSGALLIALELAAHANLSCKRALRRRQSTHHSGLAIINLLPRKQRRSFNSTNTGISRIKRARLESVRASVTYLNPNRLPCFARTPTAHLAHLIRFRGTFA